MRNEYKIMLLKCTISWQKCLLIFILPFKQFNNGIHNVAIVCSHLKTQINFVKFNPWFPYPDGLILIQIYPPYLSLDT
jgi:hypothetical protein